MRTKSITTFFMTIAVASTVALAADAPINTLTDQEKADGWQLLFNGQNLDNWKASENQGTFTAEDGILIVHGKRSHLFYAGDVHNADFINFHLSADVLTKPKANSGLYFHTAYQQNGWPAAGYEFQVNNTTLNNQINPDVAVLSDGRYVIAWAGNDLNAVGTTAYETYAKIYSADGSTVLVEDFTINDDPINNQSAPQVLAMIDNTGFQNTRGPFYSPNKTAAGSSRTVFSLSSGWVVVPKPGSWTDSRERRR